MKRDDKYAVWSIMPTETLTEMTRIDPGLTVILPCAGSGSRLGLDTPKELYEIFPGVRLIDFSLRHIQAFIRSFESDSLPPIKVAVVTRPWKLEVAHYVQKQLPDVEVETVFFDDEYHDWPGSVYSAALNYSERNIVMLPDSFLAMSDNDPYHDSSGIPLIEAFNQRLTADDLVFGAIPCSDSARLQSLGALFVEKGFVIRFCDKPDGGFDLYNSFWGCYGFTQSIGSSLYQFMLASVQKQPVPTSDSSLFPAAAIPIATYSDLGTWPSITAFRAEWSSANNCSK